MPCFALKVHNFYLTKKSVIISTGVYSIRLQKTDSPAAGTEIVHLGNSKGSVLVSYSATNKYYCLEECRGTRNGKEFNTKFQQKWCRLTCNICRKVWIGQKRWRAVLVHSFHVLFHNISSMKRWHYSNVTPLSIMQSLNRQTPGSREADMALV